MNKITAAIQKIVKNRKIARDFKESIFGGVKVVVSGEDVDRIYDTKEYESISRSGPYLLPVRAIKSEVYDWCSNAKGKVRIADEFRNDFGSESFYFSRIKDAEEFKKVYKLTCSLEFKGQALYKVEHNWKFSYPTGIMRDVINLSLVAMLARVGVYLGENVKF